MGKWQPEIPLEQMNKEQLLALQPIHYWLYFMQEAKNWLSLPDSLSHIPIMRALMATLEEISDRSENWARYLSAQDAMRVKISDDELREQAKQDLKETKEKLSETTSELTEAQSELTEAQAKLAAYREKLIAAGIDPDSV